MDMEDSLDIIKTIRAAYDSTKVGKAAQALTHKAQENFKTSNSLMGNISGVNQSDEALLASFYKLPTTQQASILQDAVLAHQQFNWYRGQKINTVRDLEMFDLKTWAVKVFTAGIILFVFVAGLALLFIPGNGDTPISNRVESLKDIFSLIFSD